MDYFVYGLLMLSLILNAVQAYRLFKKHHILNVGAKEILSELLSGEALVKIQVIDPAGMFYRSPKG